MNAQHEALRHTATILFRQRLELINAAQQLEAAGYTTVPAIEALMDTAREAAHAIAAEQRQLGIAPETEAIP